MRDSKFDIAGKIRMEDIKNIIGKIKNDFGEIGTRIKIIPFTPSSRLFKSNLVSVSVAHDEQGEFFEILITKDMIKDLKVVRINMESNHLIMVAGQQAQYLCGSYEGSLFMNNLTASKVKVKKETTVKEGNGGDDKEKNVYMGKPGLNFSFLRFLFNRDQTSGYLKYFN